MILMWLFSRLGRKMREPGSHLMAASTGVAALGPELGACRLLAGTPLPRPPVCPLLLSSPASSASLRNLAPLWLS